MIYNGPTSEVTGFLSKLGIQMNKYTNPADVLLKLANDPSLFGNITIPSLSLKC